MRRRRALARFADWRKRKSVTVSVAIVGRPGGARRRASVIVSKRNLLTGVVFAGYRAHERTCIALLVNIAVRERGLLIREAQATRIAIEQPLPRAVERRESFLGQIRAALLLGVDGEAA